MDRLLIKSFCVLVVALGLFQGCKITDTSENDRIYNSLASLSLLNLPDGFLPTPGNCKIYFPDYPPDDQPYRVGCDTEYMLRDMSQLVIRNIGAEETPVFSVLELIKVKDGFRAKSLYFADKKNPDAEKHSN